MAQSASRSSNPVYQARFVGCGLSLKAAATWLGVHPRTLERQERGQSKPSGPVLRALELRAGELGAIHPAWSGWHLAPDGRLYSPCMPRGFAPEHLHALEYVHQHRSALERKYRRLKAARCLFCTYKWRWKRKRKKIGTCPRN